MTKKPTLLEVAQGKLVEATATLAALEKQHAPALRAQEAALAAARKAMDTHAKECHQRGADYLKLVGFSRARALKHIFAALNCTQADVDAQELMASSYLPADTAVSNAVYAIESTLRRAALVPEDAVKKKRLTEAHEAAYRQAHYQSKEKSIIEQARRTQQDLRNEVEERSRKVASVEKSAEKKAKTDPRLIKARKMLREGFTIEAFGVTTKVPGK
jgi:hypothetical protein